MKHKKLLYIILPLLFFGIWYCTCAFVAWKWNPSEMSEANRYVIAAFGLIAAVCGIPLANYINEKISDMKYTKQQMIAFGQVVLEQRVDSRKLTIEDIFDEFLKGRRCTHLRPYTVADETEYQRGYNDGYEQASSEAAEEIRENYVPIEDYRNDLNQ